MNCCFLSSDGKFKGGFVDNSFLLGAYGSGSSFLQSSVSKGC